MTRPSLHNEPAAVPGPPGAPLAETAASSAATARALQGAILTSPDFSIIAADEHGIIQLFNVGAERMLGYARRRLWGESARATCRPRGGQGARANVDAGVGHASRPSCPSRPCTAKTPT